MNGDEPANTPESELSVQTFWITLLLEINANDSSEASSRLIQAMATLRDLEHMGLRGLRFVRWIDSHVDEWKLQSSLDGRIESQWSYPVRIEVAAGTPAEALSRRERLVHWMESLVAKGLISLGEGVGVQPSAKHPEPLDAGSFQIKPTIGRMLHPYFDEWFRPISHDDPDDESCDQAKTVLKWHSLSLKTSTMTDAVVSLRQVAKALIDAGDEVQSWKWVIVSLHNAVQGFMVLALEGTNPHRVCRPTRIRTRWSYRSRTNRHGRAEKLRKHKSNIAEPDLFGIPGQLRDFLDLYHLMKRDAWMLQYMGSRTFKPGGTTGTSMQRLNHYRNQFTHFVPTSWRIYPEVLASFPLMVEDCIDLIQFAAFESGNPHWDRQPELEIETRRLIDDIRGQTARLSLYFYGEIASISSKVQARRYLLKSLKGTLKQR